jgi:uncharacterized protein (DUF4415 family)
MIEFRKAVPDKKPAKPAKAKKPTAAQIAALKAQVGTGDLKSPKKLVSIRLDQEIVTLLKATRGDGWTSHINSVLRADLGI